MKMLGFGIVVLAALSAMPARADQAECSQAYEQAQRSRKAGKLLDSRAQLLTCAQDECPGFIHRDCAGWLTEVEHETPSLSVRVLDRQGCDRPGVPLLLDGRAIDGVAEGAALEVDPGTHTLRAQLDGDAMEQTIVVARSERGRVVILAAGTETACIVRKGPTTVLAPSSPERPASKPVPTLALVLGGVGIVGLGVGTAFSVSGWHQRSVLDDCRGSCAGTDVDTARRSFLVGDIGLGVGVVALVAATVVYLTR